MLLCNSKYIALQTGKKKKCSLFISLNEVYKKIFLIVVFINMIKIIFVRWTAFEKFYTFRDFVNLDLPHTDQDQSRYMKLKTKFGETLFPIISEFILLYFAYTFRYRSRNSVVGMAACNGLMCRSSISCRY